MRRHGVALLLLASIAVCAACVGESPGAEPPAENATPAAEAWQLPEPDLGYNAREGRATFRYYCAVCHGEQGHGDGFNAYNLDPKPRDLSDAAFQASRSDADLLSVVRLGGGFAGLSSAMPPWGRTLNDRQLHNVVEYVRTLAEPAAQSEGDAAPE